MNGLPPMENCSPKPLTDGDPPMGLPKKTLWPLEPHTRGKHLVLKSYLDAWLPIMGTRNARILVIDGFAGPTVSQCCQTRTAGSGYGSEILIGRRTYSL